MRLKTVYIYMYIYSDRKKNVTADEAIFFSPTKYYFQRKNEIMKHLLHNGGFDYFLFFVLSLIF